MLICFTPFVLILYSSCVGEGLKMRITHAVRMFVVHCFCGCFVGESAGYVWQFKMKILKLCDIAIEHQNSAVDYAPFNFMKSWCSPCTQILFLAVCMYWKWWKAEQEPGNEATVLCCSCVCVCVRACVLCMCGRGRSSTSLIICVVCEIQWSCCTCQRFHLYPF